MRAWCRVAVAVVLAIAASSPTRAEESPGAEGEGAEARFREVEGRRAVHLREALVARAAPEGVVPAAIGERVRHAREAVVEATVDMQEALSAGVLSELREARRTLHAARDVYAAALREQHRALRPERAGATLLPATRADVQQALDAHTVFVSYADDAGRVQGLWVAPDRAGIVDLGASADMLRAAEALEPDNWHGDVEPSIQALCRLLVEPLALAPHVRRVLVSPSALLTSLPWGALFADLDVVLVPSATVWLHGRDASREPGVGVLALADPKAAGVGGVPMPAAREEALAIGTVVYVGASATETAAREGLARSEPWRAVHLVCPAGPEPGERFCRALCLGGDGEHDGLFTALEIEQLAISADLVVLGSCASARGTGVRGESIPPLVEALLAAGAQRVIASLNAADDRATKALMVHFYEAWTDPEEARPSAAESLRRAQARVRQHAEHPEWSHPTFWAGWVLWGTP